MAKLKCANCGLYSDATNCIRVGIQSYCSPACRSTPRKRKSRPRPRTRSISTDQRTRKKIKERDRGCKFCRTIKDLHVHHVVYRSQGGTDEHHNLITLCAEHHALVHSDKRRYMPLCLGVIWLSYSGRDITIPQLERNLRRETAA